MKMQGVVEVWRESAEGYSTPMTARKPSAAAATCRRAPNNRRSVGDTATTDVVRRRV